MIPRKVSVRALDAQEWNGMIDLLATRLPISCVRTQRKWMHPWQISPEWTEDDGWVFRIKPGFVNGVDAEINTIARLASTHTLNRIEAETNKRPAEKQPATAWLTERPRVRFGATRIIGKGADQAEVLTSSDGGVVVHFEGVPEFFYQFGLTKEEVAFTGNLTSGIQILETNPATPKDPPPVLRAVDVVLAVDRLTAKLDIYRGNGFIDGFNALYSVVYGSTAPIQERPQLRTTAKYIPKTEVDLGSFSQTATDAEEDTIKIATIYLLSPNGTSPESPPDGTWRPFVKHDVFWNLAHTPAELPPLAEYEPLRLVTMLAGGIADSIFSSLLSPLNDSLSEATALLKQPNLAGRFWTL